MRENIGLYRGKRLDNGEWCEGDLIHRRIWKARPIFIRTDDDGFDNYTEYEVDPSTVGEYTGLCDRTGKRIFEGDVLFDSYDEMAGTVTYRPEDGMFAFISNEDEMYDFADVDSKNFDVIGNIHDGKEGGQ
jgi:uncharacterized phage protein (TIGR01671 family)